MTTPHHPFNILEAFLGDAVRYSIAATVVMALGLILGFRPEGSLLGTPFAVGLLLVFVNANPFSHTATAVLGIMHGTVTAGQIGLVLASSAGLIAVFGPLTMRLYRKRQ